MQTSRHHDGGAVLSGHRAAIECANTNAEGNSSTQLEVRKTRDKDKRGNSLCGQIQRAFLSLQSDAACRTYFPVSDIPDRSYLFPRILN
ncbi:hypothetical protein CHARACLAT_031168 [Characodon lateralis]|uniref:Uncharacterized protein n=1 Tax=Characodon lateralis TaxID=208331 RepID=A0ABU7ENW5_9TELE|nr:hypothetical protein [Characodon lateralis]